MGNDDEKREKLNRLEKKLYSRNAPNIINGNRSDFKMPEEKSETENEIGGKWGSAKSGGFDELAARVSRAAGNKHRMIKRIFIFSIVFFLLACGAAAFVFFGGINLISSKNVDIKVVGPLSVGGGQETSLDINVINNNSVNLESAALIVEYPNGTRSTIDLSQSLSQERFSLGEIKSGESYNQNIKAVFFGEEGNSMKIKISLEYRVENSSATFYKEKDYEFSISSAPIIVTPTYSKEVNSNQEFDLSIEVASNSKDAINNFLVTAEYPSGFVFSSAYPAADFNNNIWKLSNLETGQKKTILIKGTIIGQDNEEKVFKINAGTASSDDERVIAVPFSQLSESVLVKKPFVGLDVLVGGADGDFVSKSGGEVVTELTVRNNLTNQIFNTSVEVVLSGGAFDKSNIHPDNGGFFQSSNNTILWDKRSVTDFESFGPSDSKNLSFSLQPLLYSKISKSAKPEINMVITVKGERLLESGSSEEVTTTETRKITLATSLSLSTQTMRAIGNIENSGPIPPKADTPTTYTAVWSISNSFNQVSNAEVKATLPSYVQWTGIYSPSSESISYDSTNNQIVWKAGSILADTGFGSSAKKVYFQLKFLPSVSQVGQAPVLLNTSTLTGLDKVTGTQIETTAPEITTNFSSDSSFVIGDERVTQ